MDEGLTQVITQYTPWLMGYLMEKCGDKTLAEDLVQEVWLSVFRSWDKYREEGHMLAWLKRIAQNVYLRYVRKYGGVVCLSLDAQNDETDALAATLTDGTTAADPLLADMLSETVERALGALPVKQKQAVICRYLWDMTVPETAAMLHISQGTVKSNTSRGLNALRKQLIQEQSKGVKTMECREAMQYLYVYAAHLPEMANRDAVAAHLGKCDKCRWIAETLEKLIPQMDAPDLEGYSHWNIHFPGLVTYSYIGAPVPEYEWCQEKLKEWNGHIPADCNWFGSGFGDVVTPGKRFDNEGNEMLYELSPDTDNGMIRLRYTYLKKVYPYLHTYGTIFAEDDYWCKIETDQTGTCHGRMHNCFGNPVKTAEYQIIPKTATNIRIQQGNGVLDCGVSYAVYAARYTGENETIHLSYTYQDK